jgi:putative ABC transport system permease protein
MIIIALRNVVRNRRRSTLALAAIAAGVAAMILANGFIDWNLWQYREMAIRSQFGHVQVHRAGYREAGAIDPFAYLLPESTVERAQIEASAHVLLLAPRLSINGLVSFADAALGFVGDGVDPDRERRLGEGMNIVAGEELAAADPRGVIVGRGLAANLGAQVGDTIVLLSNTRSGAINGIEVRVRGIFETVSKDYDDVALRLPLVTAQQLLRVQGAHSWLLLLDETSRTNSVVTDLRQRFAASGLNFVAWHELSDFYNKSAALLSRQVAVITAIIGILIVLGITNTMTLSVLERTAEIGTLMAMGVRRRQVLLQFVLEASILGAFGAFLGLLAGAALAHAITAAAIPLPPPPGMARDFPAGVRVTATLVCNAITLGVATTVIASIYPAARAAQLQIVDALRHAR